MAELLIQRVKLFDMASLGLLTLKESPEFFTLEDKMREIPGAPVEQWKVAKATAMPTGRFEIIMDYSERFKREMPHILSVPGFDGIRMHGFGNIATIVNTEGCPLLGWGANMLTPNVSQSLAAAQAFYDRLRATLKVERSWITVKNPS